MRKINQFMLKISFLLFLTISKLQCPPSSFTNFLAHDVQIVSPVGKIPTNFVPDQPLTMADIPNNFDEKFAVFREEMQRLSPEEKADFANHVFQEFLRIQNTQHLQPKADKATRILLTNLRLMLTRKQKIRINTLDLDEIRQGAKFVSIVTKQPISPTSISSSILTSNAKTTAPAQPTVAHEQDTISTAYELCEIALNGFTLPVDFNIDI